MKDSRFLSFAKSIGKNISNNLSVKYFQKLAKQFALQKEQFKNQQKQPLI